MRQSKVLKCDFYDNLDTPIIRTNFQVSSEFGQSGFYCNLNHMDSHALRPFGSDLKAFILEVTKAWHVQHEFSDCRCDTVYIWYSDIFLTRGWNRNQI